jgi:hypothetical protein
MHGEGCAGLAELCEDGLQERPERAESLQCSGSINRTASEE